MTMIPQAQIPLGDSPGTWDGSFMLYPSNNYSHIMDTVILCDHVLCYPMSLFLLGP